MKKIFYPANDVIKYILFSLLFLLLYSSFFKGGHDYDMLCWRLWATKIFNDGIGNVYKVGADYLPLYHFILYVFGKIQGSPEEIAKGINFLRVFTLIFHFTSGYFLFQVIKEYFKSFEKAFLYSLFYIANVAILYNTIIWGQVDAIMTCFVFLAFIYAFRQKTLLPILFLLLGINMKLQAIIFIPPLFIVLAPNILKTFNLKNFLLSIFLIASIQFLIILPFILEGTIKNMWNVIMDSFGKYPKVSMNAFNIWELFISDDLMKINDSTTFMGISYKNIGLLAFFSTSFFALLPLLQNSIQLILNKTTKQYPIDKLLIIFALIPLLFFFLNTQMHERYSHPAMIFLVLYSIITKRPGVAILGCSAYFLNMEKILKGIGFSDHRDFFFGNEFIAYMFLVTIIWLFFLLYDGRIVLGKNKLKS